MYISMQAPNFISFHRLQYACWKLGEWSRGMKLIQRNSECTTWSFEQLQKWCQHPGKRHSGMFSHHAWFSSTLLHSGIFPTVVHQASWACKSVWKKFYTLFWDLHMHVQLSLLAVCAASNESWGCKSFGKRLIWSNTQHNFVCRSSWLHVRLVNYSSPTNNLHMQDCRERCIFSVWSYWVELWPLKLVSDSSALPFHTALVSET